MSGARFVCSDPDAGDFEFADVEAVLDALEAALVAPTTPVFDAVRQSSQPVGNAPRDPRGLGRAPPLSASFARRARTAVVAVADFACAKPSGRRGRTGAPPRSVRPGAEPDGRPGGPDSARRDDGPRLAVVGIALALALLGIIGWLAVTFAAGLNELAARAVSGGQAR